jgi:small subunit ribosomal protein S5
MINIRRVSRVIAGGRRFSFSVALIIGNKKGRVGVGLGKAGDTTLAIDKATRDAKKHMITLKLTADNSIAHEVSAKYNASRVTMMPAKGRGLVAGSSVRPVLELAGVSNIVAKVHSGSKNGLNNARAAIEALKKLKA